MKKISAVIITKNEENNLDRCLKSLENVVDEIVIIDSFSIDNTEKIARKFDKVVFIAHQWEGYSGSKNFGNNIAKNDLILSIDADEALSPELQKSILKVKEIDEDVNYQFARLSNYCGTWIKHSSWYPDSKVRLFNRKKSRWEGESVHEKLVSDPFQKIVTLKGDCYHYTIRSLDEHVNKMNQYSTLWARESFVKGRKAGYVKLLFKPLTSFLRVYLVKLGFLDGFHGFVISVFAGYSQFLRLSKLINMQKTGTP